MNNEANALVWVVRETGSVLISPMPVGPGSPLHKVGIRQITRKDAALAEIVRVAQSAPKNEAPAYFTDDQLATVVALAGDYATYSRLRFAIE